MKKLVLILSLAQGFSGLAQNDSKAESLLNEVSQKIKTYKKV